VVLALILAAIAASTRAGQVWVGAPAGMTVVFDGEEAGQGGVMVPGVAPGMHTIVVRAPGGAPGSRSGAPVIDPVILSEAKDRRMRGYRG
jgi:hypothetical protein